MQSAKAKISMQRARPGPIWMLVGAFVFILGAFAFIFIAYSFTDSVSNSRLTLTKCLPPSTSNDVNVIIEENNERLKNCKQLHLRLEKLYQEHQ